MKRLSADRLLTSYNIATLHVRKLFEESDSSRWDKIHSNSSYVVKTNDEYIIRLDFPGDKADRPYTGAGKYKHDFRVVLIDPKGKESILSHAEIAALLYTAVKCELISVPALTDQLIQLARTGDLPLGPSPILKLDPGIADKIRWGYERIKKPPPSKTFKHSISLSTLLEVTFWILLQEEINYPQPAYQGRTMAVKRFLEAIYCASSDRIALEEVIERLLNHGKIHSNLSFVDYSGIESIRPLEALEMTSLSTQIETKTVPVKPVESSFNRRIQETDQGVASIIKRIGSWLGF